MPINSSSTPALMIARNLRRKRRAGGGGLFDYSGVGEAMPEAYGADSPIRDPLVTVPKSIMYDLPKKAIDEAARNPIPGLRREDYTDIPADTSPDPQSPLGSIGINVPRQGAEPVDPMVGASLETAANVAGAPLVGAPVARAGEVALGAGAIRKAPKGLDDVDRILEQERALKGASNEPRPIESAAPAAEPAPAVDPAAVGPGGGPIRAYHGSPHDFDKFDLGKIGTGEGAQAYGHGLYFAENPAVSEAYKTSITRNPEQLADIAKAHGLTGDAAEMLAHQFTTGFGGKRFDDWMGGLKGAIDDPLLSPRVRAAAQQMLDKSVEASDAYAKMKSPGKMYEVNINAHPEHFLDWDKPLSEQSQHVRDAIAKADSSISTREPSLSSIKDPEIRSIVRRALKQNEGSAQGLELAIDNDSGLYNSAVSHAKRGKIDLDAQDMRASDYIYQQAKPYIDALHAHQNMVGDSRGRVLGVKGADMMQAGPAAARLREAGLPGIKYLDQGSRAAGDGSRNYVVFDHNLIDIVKKYAVAGIALPPAIAAEYAEMQKRNEGDQEGGLSDLPSEGRRLHKDRGGAAVEPLSEMDGVADRESSGTDVSDIQRGGRGGDGAEPAPQVRDGFDPRGMVSSKGRSGRNVGGGHRGAISQGNRSSGSAVAAGHGMAAGAIKRAMPGRKGNGGGQRFGLLKKNDVASGKKIGRYKNGGASKSDYVDPASRAVRRAIRRRAEGGGLSDEDQAAMMPETFVNPLVKSALTFERGGPRETENPRFRTASPLVNIGDEDIDRAMNVGMGAGPGATRDPALWHGISKVKLPKPISEMSAVHEPVQEVAEKVISPASLQGSSLLPLIGDRTGAGSRLTQVNGYKFADPVEMQGGHGFMAANTDREAAWASAQGVAQRLASNIRKNAGADPIHGVYTAMGERSADFSHHVSDTLSEMLKHKEIPQAARDSFDRQMLSAAPTWPGVDAQNLRQYLVQAPGAVRAAFAKLMDTSVYQKAGFPSVAEARYATTDPRLLHEGTGASGLSISRLDPSGKIFKSPDQHLSYDTNVAGKYVGGLPTSVPKEVMYPDIVKPLEAYRDALPGYKPTIDYLMTRTPKGLPIVQKADQHWVDSVSKHLEDKGFKFEKGGSVNAAMKVARRIKKAGDGSFSGASPLPYAYPLMPQQTNLPQADAAMNLSPQEQALYMRHITNLYGPGGVDNAPTPDNPEGSRSTLYQSVEPHEGRYYNVPTVWDGAKQTIPYQRSDGSSVDVANSTALNNVEKTGWDKFPSYGTADEADARYGQMHDFMDKDTGEYFDAKGRAVGGSVDAAMDIARRLKRAKGGKVHVGPIVGNTGGRADEVPMEVPDGAYVLRADFVSGLGEGNTDSGMLKLGKMFPESKPSRMRALKGSPVPVLVSHGEFVVSPESIKERWGDLDFGHKALDHWQTSERENLIKTLKGLPPPAQD